MQERMSGVEQERMEERAQIYIVSWNVQRMSMKEHYRKRLRNLCRRIQREGWAALLFHRWVEEGQKQLLGEGGWRKN